MEQSKIAAKILNAFPDALIPLEDAAYLSIVPEKWETVAHFLRNDEDLLFDSLMCLTGYDKGLGEELGVAFNLHSMDKLHELEIRVEVPRDGGVVPSVHMICTALFSKAIPI
jgi:NADH:ubiquinone oxidoreductase subunit C